MKDNILAEIKFLVIYIGGLTALFTNLDIILKVMLTAMLLCYGIWKWRVEYLKNKSDK